MSASSIGALIGRRKSPADPNNPTDPVRAHSWDVDDPKANPGRRIGDGSPEFGWAFSEALRHAGRRLYDEHYDNDYAGPHPMQHRYLAVLSAMLAFLDFRTGELTVPYAVIAEKARTSENTAKRAVACFEFWGLVQHVRRSMKVEGAKGMARPQRKQAPNAYFFDCRRSMAASLWEKFWSRVLWNLKRVGHAAARRAVLLKHSFNEVAKQAPRAASSELAALLARIERNHFSEPVVAAGPSAST